MTQNEIIEMANKAFDESSFTDAEVLRFAKLVAEKEREACAKLVDYWEARHGEHSDAIIARGKA